ncbi:3-dehydroquinate synthase II family protein [Gordonia sp. OPL2]|nr:3-dehydroquinate synthase II family protein [Gordonia sp. OPL2]
MTTESLVPTARKTIVSTSTDIVTDDITPLSAVASDPSAIETATRREHLAWIDVRGVADHLRDALVQAAIHHRISGIVSDDPDLLADLPPTVRRVLAATGASVDADVAATVDVVLGAHSGDDENVIVDAGPSAEAGVHVVVSDADTLRHACETVRRAPWTVLTFTDPTKIPLEIVIAAAENSGGRTVTVVNDIEDAEIVKLVLEHGSDGLLLSPRSADDVATLAEVIRPSADRIELSELTVTKVEHIGMGERACIDTCSLLEKDEGCLIGSFSTGMFLSCSETHPLPYMPTRPFRWNAGAVHSYVLVPDNRTRYVSELQAGQPILAIRSTGEVREVRIGRVKIERRPLISVSATAPDGRKVNVIAQDDWHVRLLGPGGSVNNVTDLKPGDKLLGYAPEESRHVGLPITEFCDER